MPRQPANTQHKESPCKDRSLGPSSQLLAPAPPLLTMSTPSSSPASATSHDDAVTRWWGHGSSPLLARCVREYGWSWGFAERVLQGYKKFLQLKTHLCDWDHKILSPSIPVDKMWHMHILDVANYIKDCELLCGRLVGHNPDGMLDAEARSRRVETTKHILQNQLGEDLDAGVWDFGAVDGGVGDNNGSDEESPDSKRRRIDPPRAPVANELIAIRIKDANGEETQFKVKHTTKMGKVFKAYSELKGISRSTLRFRLDGNPVGEDNTAQYLELEDGDQIDVMLEQCGC